MIDLTLIIVFLCLGALEDMAPPAKADGARKEGIGSSSVDPNLALDGVDWNPSENVWSEEFLQQAAATFESNMASLLSSMKGCSGNHYLFHCKI